MYDIARYLNVRSAHGATFAPDGTLGFLLDATGTPQVWTLADAGGWPVAYGVLVALLLAALGALALNRALGLGL